MPGGAELIISLVHRRDELIAERDRRIVELDQEIETIDAQLEMIARGGRHRGPVGPFPTPSDEDEEDAGDDSSSGAKTDRLLWWINTHHMLDYGAIAIELHGEDTPRTRKRVRSSLAYLARQGRIKNLGTNTWEVVG